MVGAICVYCENPITEKDMQLGPSLSIYPGGFPSPKNVAMTYGGLCHGNCLREKMEKERNATWKRQE